MDFHEALANDRTSPVSRAVGGRTEQSLRGLEAFRKTLDDALVSLDSALKTAAENDRGAETSGLVERLMPGSSGPNRAPAGVAGAEPGQTPAAGEPKGAGEPTLVEREKALDGTARRLSEAEEKIQAMLATQEDRRRRHEALVISMADVQGQLDTMQGELDAERQHVAGAIRDLADANSARERAQFAAKDAEAARRQHEHARKSLERELLEVRAALDRMAKDAEGRRRDLQVNVDAAAGREATLRERVARAEEEALKVPASAALDFDRLIATYQELENGVSVAAVLMALTEGLSGQFARVALFDVCGKALQGSYQRGFDVTEDITGIMMPLTMESVLTRAFRSGRLETAAGEGRGDIVGLPFGGESPWCLALPVSLEDETIAVIYADHGQWAVDDRSLQPSHVAFAELLRRHAIPVLVRLAVGLRARSELRAYAMLLLDEVEYIYGADVNSGRQNVELVERLTQTVRCAQEAYARRLESMAQPCGGPDLFEERLDKLLSTTGATAFGRDLSAAAATLVRETSSAAPAATRPAAQLF